MERLTGQIQPYAWGSPTFIPELLGYDATNEPQAELWLGAHPSAPSSIRGRGLDELVSEDPETVVGAVSVDRFGPVLPYLLKVLAADKPLSLQAHPSRAQAEDGFARENEAGVARDAANRLYRDDWPKPEALCALMDSEALCGFREPAQTYALFEQLGVGSALELVALLARSDAGSTERLAGVFERIMRLEDTSVVDEVVAAAGSVDGAEGDFGVFVRTARTLGEAYPGDPGVMAALLMNRISLQPLEAVYLPAGNLHAYLNGGGIEVMANSDNVLRGGLTPKHVDVDELLAVLDFTPGFPGLVEPVEEAPQVWRYPTPAPEFALWRIEAGELPIDLPGAGLGRVVLATRGSARLEAAGLELTLDRGQSAFVSASESVRVSGFATLFVAGPGVY